MRVALIEDHDLTRDGIRLALQNCPEIEFVGEATSGESGLALLITSKPDVAIIDLGLPDISGVEVTRRFRSIVAPEYSAVKILILTLQDDETSIMAAFGAGADSYCMKNISIDNLIKALKVTYKGDVWIDPAIGRIILDKVKNIPVHTLTADAKVISENLTDRELEVLQLIVNGCSNAVIAEELCITVGTVKTHVHSILNKLAASDRTQAAVRALRSGLVS